MEKQFLYLIQLFEGYVRNYRRLNLSQLHNRSMFTNREIEYFAKLGEMLGFDAYIEDSKFDKTKGRSRPMDLSWWKWDARVDDQYFLYLALHLERENSWSKDVETIEKLFSQTEEEYVPHNVIGIQFIETEKRIDYLNNLVLQKNSIQNSNALMIYRYDEGEVERVCAYYFTPKGLEEVRIAICEQDDLGYSFMCFEEEFVTKTKKRELANCVSLLTEGSNQR